MLTKLDILGEALGDTSMDAVFTTLPECIFVGVLTKEEECCGEFDSA